VLGLLLIVMDSKEVMVGMSPISTDALNSKSQPLVVFTATTAAIGAPSSMVGSIMLLGGMIAYGRSI
jgi:hypothetical protein